jgi:hypothetical protein
MRKRIIHISLVSLLLVGSFLAAFTTSGLAATGVIGHPIYLPIVSNQHPANSTIVVRQQQAFDYCGIPSLATMQNWWNNSPYRTFNIYLGGSARASGCNFSALTNSWLSSIDKMGWTLILTWVGPQSPCSGYIPKFSSDPNTAYQQGRSEADQAVTQARNLGFLKDLLIYNDIEYYKDDGTCGSAVKAYVSGWVSRLHEHGVKAGAYSISCTSKMAEWASIANVPDQVWMAYYNKDGFDSNVSVFGIPCLSDSLWPNHQRMHQYAGDFSDTWGGKTISIDSSVLDADVVAYGDGGLAASTTSVSASGMETETVGPRIVDYQMLDSDAGWVLTNNHLLWTSTAGDGWTDITPTDAPDVTYSSASFSDALHGWVAGISAQDGTIQVFATGNGGQTWQAARLGAGADGAVAGVSLDFVDAQTGWAAVKFQSSAVFSLGELYKTTDGGDSWARTDLPAAGRIHFADTLNGVLTGGVTGQETYITSDGGETWQLTDMGANSDAYISAAVTGLDRGQLARVALPKGALQAQFTDADHGWALTQDGSCTGAKDGPDFHCVQTNQMLRTGNGGASWTTVSLP